METVADEGTRYQMIDELRPLCEVAGLELRRSNDTHFQIMHEGIAVVDVWPTRNKYRRVTAHPDANAMVGKARDAVQLAVNCANGKHPKPCSPKKAMVRDGTLRDEFAMRALQGLVANRDALEGAASLSGLKDGEWEIVKPESTSKSALIVATWAYDYADAMLTIRDQKPKEKSNGSDSNAN